MTNVAISKAVGLLAAGSLAWTSTIASATTVRCGADLPLDASAQVASSAQPAVLFEIVARPGDAGEPLSGVRADLNRDGRTDLAWVESVQVGPGLSDSRQRVAIMLSGLLPRGTIDMLVTMPDASIVSSSGFWDWGPLAVGDVNGDGYDDLLVTTWNGREQGVDVHLGPFLSGERRDLGVDPAASTWQHGFLFNRHDSTLDLDGDRRDEVLIGRRTDGQPVVVFGRDDLPRTLDLEGEDASFLRFRLAARMGRLSMGGADLDGDGLDELMVVVVDVSPRLAVVGEGVRAPGWLDWEAQPLMSSVLLDTGAIPIAGPAGCQGVESLVLRGDNLAVFDPRPREHWPAIDQPDLVGFIDRGVRAAEFWSLADFTGDGHRDIALGRPAASDASGTIPNHGLVTIASLGAAPPGRVNPAAGSPILITPPRPEMRGFGYEIGDGDFDGDGIADLAVKSFIFERFLPRSVLTVFRGGSWPDVVTHPGCEELVSMRESESAAPAWRRGETDLPLAAWGRVATGGALFDPLYQTGPFVTWPRLGDPTLHIDGQLLGEVLLPRVEATAAAYRGMVRSDGWLDLVVPSAPGAEGVHHACLGPHDRPPLVAVGDDVLARTAPDDVECLATVRLAGAVHDLDCDAIAETSWRVAGAEIATGLDAEVRLAVGTHDVELVATDGLGAEGRDALVIEVLDATAPSLSATVVQGCLWPPDHRLQEVVVGRDVLVQSFDNCDPAPVVRIESVTVTDVGNRGDGHHDPDAILVDGSTVLLRRERSGQGAGRAYTLWLVATDRAGNEARGSVSLTVPHDVSSSDCSRARVGATPGVRVTRSSARWRAR